MHQHRVQEKKIDQKPAKIKNWTLQHEIIKI